ncbi:hypothetical protein CCH79_00020248, partial [Gambusia affinis]
SRSGVALLCSGENGDSFDVCLRLSRDTLTIQKLDVVCTNSSEPKANVSSPAAVLSLPAEKNPSANKNSPFLKHRAVVLRRQAAGGLGLSIKGGAEHNVPVVISKIFKDQVGKKRSNSFELFSPDTSSCSVLQFCSAAESLDWLQAIAANIGELTQESIKMLNKSSSSDDQIVHMGWVCESPENSAPCRSLAFSFLALRGPYFYIFRRPPVSATDWGKPETTYNLYEVLFKVHKLWLAEDCWLQARLFLGLHGSPEQPDGDPLCFSILVGHGQSHTFRVELASDLATWDKSFQRAVFLEVQRVGSKSYMCSSQGSVLSFTLDFGSGFSCSDVTSKAVLWRYKFSQLKGSSDDGKTRVKLLFKNADSNQIEMKELEFANLTAVLHCIHSFIAAKVASLEPGFLCSQSLATHISS